ncbi:MAG: ABC transporter substrate-binding protein [Gammaproteobacteria bacterium]|nr:ABC transporter substrate-binding protein [Gammaproteobacteria bacterium]
MRNLIASLLTVFGALIAVSPAVQSQNGDDPGPAVMDTVNQVLVVLRDTRSAEADKRARVYTLVEDRIDFEGMSRRILALDWKNLDQAQRAKFQDLFRQLLLDSYWAQMRKYKDEKAEYVTAIMEGDDDATVDTIILSGDVEIPVTYRMSKIGGKWMAYDILVESLSLTSNYRNEFRNVIKSKGIDGLFERMQSQIDYVNQG